MSENCDVIAIFLIYSQFGAIRKMDSDAQSVKLIFSLIVLFYLTKKGVILPPPPPTNESLKSEPKLRLRSTQRSRKVSNKMKTIGQN